MEENRCVKQGGAQSVPSGDELLGALTSGVSTGLGSPFLSGFPGRATWNRPSSRAEAREHGGAAVAAVPAHCSLVLARPGLRGAAGCALSHSKLCVCVCVCVC